MKQNKDFIVLVTGGTTGIGKAVVLALTKLGMTVIANYIVISDTDKNELNSAGVHLEKFDVSSFNETKKGFEKVLKKFKRIDVLINNAGITKDVFFHKSNPDQWESVISVNLLSVFNCTRQVIEQMRKNKFGKIINLSSVNALKGQIGQTNYCASKAGVIGFTKALARESSLCGITVNCIAPGYVNTEMTKVIDNEVMGKQILPNIPIGRLAEPSEIADVVIFLITKGNYITGQVLSINGGMLMP